MAGETAREIARQRRERSEQRARQADLREKGSRVEQATASLLDTLTSLGWHTWHDVAWPGRDRATIDHVLLGPGGLFVIDSVHWSGRITAADDGLRQGGRRRDSAVRGAEEAALAVSATVGYLPTTGVICFVRDEAVRGWVRDVMVCSTTTLLEMAVTSRARVLHPAAVERHAAQMDRALRPAHQQVRVPRPRSGPASGSRPASSARGPAAVRRRSRAQRLARALPGWLATLLAIAVGVTAVMSLVDRLAVDADGTEVLAVGQAAALGGSEGRPAVQVVVTGVSRTAPAGEDARVPSGRQLMAVHLRLENDTEESWVARRKVRATLDTDPTGRLSPASRFPRVRAGKLLATEPVLKPGRTMKRVVVFVVPEGADPVGVRVQLDPLADPETRWIL